MFTGIVEEIGQVVEVAHADPARGGSLSVAAATVVADLRPGASIAVEGVCLTVTDWQLRTAGALLQFDVMGETFRCTTLGLRRPGDRVNLERAVRADDRLGGHVVQGHVDGTGEVISRAAAGNWELLRFRVPSELARYVAAKGAIAIDGVSLTVSAVGGDSDEPGGQWFEVGLIPETMRATTLGLRAPGEQVNLEVDVLAKYAERLLSGAPTLERQ